MKKWLNQLRCHSRETVQTDGGLTNLAFDGGIIQVTLGGEIIWEFSPGIKSGCSCKLRMW